MSRIYSDWLTAYLEYTAHSEAPEIFHFWTGISVIAGALRRKTWIHQRYFLWTPNFYIIFVAPPGTATKSTTVNFGTRLLRNIKDVHFGPNVLTWQRLVQSMAQNQEGVEIPNALGEPLIVPMSCITITGSELGTLLNPNDREMLDVLTDLWDGWEGVWKKETKQSGSDEIYNPWINLIACTTPAWLSGHIPQHMIDAGFFSRTIFIYRDKKRHAIAYPADRVPADFEENGLKLQHDLEMISLIKGEYKLSDAAKELGTEWYLEHIRRVEANDPHLARLGTYASRKQAHMHKIAMVLAASKSDELIIQATELARAIEILEAAEEDMSRIYSLAGDDRSISNANHLVELLRLHKTIPKDIAFKLLYSRMNWEDFNKAIVDASMASRIKQSQKGEKLILEFTDE